MSTIWTHTARIRFSIVFAKETLRRPSSWLMQDLLMTLLTLMAKLQSTTRSSKAATKWLNFCWKRGSTSYTRTNEEPHLWCLQRNTTEIKSWSWWYSMAQLSVTERKRQHQPKPCSRNPKKNKKLTNGKFQNGTCLLLWEKAAITSLWQTKSSSSLRSRTLMLQSTSSLIKMGSLRQKLAVCRYQMSTKELQSTTTGRKRPRAWWWPFLAIRMPISSWNLWMLRF